MKYYQILLATLIAILMLAATGCPPSQPAETQDEGNGDEDSDEPVEIGDAANTNPDGEGKTVVMETPDGTFEMVVSEDGTTTYISDGDGLTVTNAPRFPEGWPEEIGLVEGLEIVGGLAATGESSDDDALVVYAEGDVAIADIIKFYEALPGWSKDDKAGFSMVSNDFAMLMLARGEEMLSVQTSREEDDEATMLVLTYKPEV